MIGTRPAGAIEGPEGLVEVEPELRGFYRMLLGMHLDPPRGYSGTATYQLVKRLRKQLPRALAIDDAVLWIGRRHHLERYQLHVMTRGEFEHHYGEEVPNDVRPGS